MCSNIFVVMLSIVFQFFCSWTLPIFWGGLKHEMEEENLYEPLKEHASGKAL